MGQVPGSRSGTLALSRTPEQGVGWGCGETWCIQGPSCGGGGSAPGRMPVSPQLRLWSHSGGWSWGAPGGRQGLALPQHLQGRLRPPSSAALKENRPLQEGPGGRTRGLDTSRGGVAPGNLLLAEPQSLGPGLCGVSFRPGVWGLCSPRGGGTPSRPARIRRPSGWGVGQACSLLPPTAGQGWAGGQDLWLRPAVSQGARRQQTVFGLIDMTKCHHYCRLTECRSGQFPKIILNNVMS